MLPYTDRHGIIRDERTGKPIGVKPRVFETPLGTWNYYPDIDAIEEQQREFTEPEQPPVDMLEQSRPSSSGQDPFSINFGGPLLGGDPLLGQPARKNKNPFNISF